MRLNNVNLERIYEEFLDKHINKALLASDVFEANKKEARMHVIENNLDHAVTNSKILSYYK